MGHRQQPRFKPSATSSRLPVGGKKAHRIQTPFGQSHIPSQTVEKLLFFARRVTLASSEIRFSVKIARRDPVAGRRRRWRVVGTNNSVPPVCVMHRGRDRRTTQGDQKAQGQNRTHRFFSNRSVAIRSGRSRRGRSLIRLGDNNAGCFVVPGKSKWPPRCRG